MTGCVSYFAATLTDTLGPAPFQDPQASSFTSSLGLCFEGRVDSSLLYIYIWDLKSMSVLKAVISNFQWVKKRPIERPPTRRDTRSIGHFQHSRKTLLVSWPKRVSQEVRSKNYKESSKSAAKQKIILYRPSNS